jgi:hypothetical protein
MALSAAERRRREAEMWHAPAALLAAAQASPWAGDALEPGDAQRPIGRGTRALGRELRELFPDVVRSVGYAGPELDADHPFSMHHAGRALDAMIPTVDGRPDPRGDAVAAWLLEHARELGVQYLIWRGTQWSSRTGRTSLYGGRRDHWDHVHVDLTNAGAAVAAPAPAPPRDGSSGATLLAVALGGWALYRWRTGRRR